ncbi:MAG: type II toxin-antitoxin system VapC family toxin [Candidatus Methylumidiphilus sp.]
MGLAQGLVYLDSCLVIYTVEEHPRFGHMINQAIESNYGMRFCISPLVELECLVMPLRNCQQTLVERYEMFLQDYILLDISPAIYRKAAELRAHYGLKTPDALHLATAQTHGCVEFWTNDDRLNKIVGQLAVNVLVTKTE